MSRLEELLLKFQDGSATSEERRELSGLLEQPEARAALVDDLFLTSAIRGHLRSASERRTAVPAVGSRRVVRTARSLHPPSSRTWAWVAAGVLAAIFLLILTSSPQQAPRTAAKPQTLPAPVLPPKAVPEPVVSPSPEPPPRLPEPTPRPTPPQEPSRPEPERVPLEVPKPPPAPEAPPEPKPAPEPPPPARSQVVGIARIEKVEGTAFLVAKEGKAPVVAGAEVAAGQGLETGGADSRLIVVFPDKTRVELGADSALTDVKVDGGPRLALAAGTIRADVAPQAKTRPFIVVTPHAEAKVVGTVLRVVADRDPKKGTLLEVEKGRVEFRRLSDRKMVVVGAGQSAVAAAGVDLKVKPLPLPQNAPLARFTFDDGKTSPEWTGSVAAGPPRAGNTGCLEGKYLQEERLTRVMLSDDANGIFVHRDGAVLTFDYYADGETQILSVYVWNRTQQLSMGQYENRNLTRRQWTRATVPLSELRDGDKRLQEGDLIKNLTIQTNRGNGILFVDNVEIAVPRSK